MKITKIIGVVIISLMSVLIAQALIEYIVGFSIDGAALNYGVKWTLAAGYIMYCIALMQIIIGFTIYYKIKTYIQGLNK